MCFLIWKLLAMGYSFSYRYKWVRTVDAVALSAIIILHIIVYVRWNALYRYGGEWFYYLMVALFFGLSILFTRHSYVLDKARHQAPEPDCHTDTPE
jgi:hypothetical protein